MAGRPLAPKSQQSRVAQETSLLSHQLNSRTIVSSAGFDPPPGMSGYFFDPTFDLPSETPEKSGYFLPLSSANCATFLISLRSALVKSLGHLIVRTPKSVQPPATHKPSTRRRCSAAMRSCILSSLSRVAGAGVGPAALAWPYQPSRPVTLAHVAPSPLS